MVGRGQAVRHGTLDPAFEGSNPSAPASPSKESSRVSFGMARTELKLFSGSAHPLLAQEIAEFLGVTMGQCRLHRFPDSEVSFQIDENIRGMDVFIVQPTSRPVDEHLMELCIMMDAFRRSSAARITAVIPYYGYARQDRKDKPRVPISAKLVANLLSAAGADRVLTMDLHKAQIQGWFGEPFRVETLSGHPAGCTERWTYTYAYSDRGGARTQAKTLVVDFDAGGSVCDHAFVKQ